MNITAKVALRMIPDSLATQPIFLCVDDTMVAKAGTRFENVSKLFDHAAHNGSNYLNGHCFAYLYGRMTGYWTAALETYQRKSNIFIIQQNKRNVKDRSFSRKIESEWSFLYLKVIVSDGFQNR